MRQHALTHKNSERSNSPNSSNTNSDNEQISQTERNRDIDPNEQSDEEGDATESITDEAYGQKRVDNSPLNINSLHNIEEEKGQRQQSFSDQDEQEDITRNQSNSSKNKLEVDHVQNFFLDILYNTISSKNSDSQIYVIHLLNKKKINLLLMY